MRRFSDPGSDIMTQELYFSSRKHEIFRRSTQQIVINKKVRHGVARITRCF